MGESAGGPACLAWPGSLVGTLGMTSPVIQGVGLGRTGGLAEDRLVSGRGSLNGQPAGLPPEDHL
jgi:hypothetical protein